VIGSAKPVEGSKFNHGISPLPQISLGYGYVPSPGI
jgi:hypothetical protein